MAGKRQHYVPQFLQRGFLHDSSEEAERTWLHRQGAKPRLVGIRDAGVGEYFYSKLGTVGVATLDDLITEMEGGMDGKVKALRSAPVGNQIDPSLAAQLTTHLVLRTAHVRSIFERSFTLLLDGSRSLFTDPNIFRDIAGVDKPNVGSPVHNAMQEALASIPLEAMAFPRSLAERLALFMVRENFDLFHQEHTPELIAALNELTGRVATTIREAHNKVLTESHQTHWEKELSKLSWDTQAVTDAFLPDCIALARETGQDFMPLLLSDRQRVELIVMPIAHDRVLVGSRHGNVSVAALSLNSAFAACSSSFFLSRNPQNNSDFSDLIGHRSAVVIHATVHDALLDLPGAGNLLERRKTEEICHVDTGTAEPFSFSLTCVGFGDSRVASKLGEVLQVIVLETSRTMPLSKLDGITFAADYPAAVANLDRGDAALSAAQSDPRTYGVAVAKAIDVKRDGVFKTHLVMAARIADSLLSQSEEDQAMAVHTVVGMLSCTAHVVLYEGQLENPLTVAHDKVNEFLYQAAAPVPFRYFSARQSAFADPQAGERYAALVRDSFNAARIAVFQAKIAYAADADMDALLRVALPQISFVLCHVAEWLGHRDGLPNQDEFPGVSLLVDLQARDLSRWVELLGRDLRILYEVEGNFTYANLVAFSAHVERLLWTVQLFPWLTDDGLVFISVLPDVVATNSGERPVLDE